MEGQASSNSLRPDAYTNCGKYDTHDRHRLYKTILVKYVTYDPLGPGIPIYILAEICPVMDRFDLLATTPTRSGQTGYFVLLMLVVREIAADMTLAIANAIFPRDPALIVVCPPKALEDEIVSIIITNDRIQLT